MALEEIIVVFKQRDQHCVLIILDQEVREGRDSFCLTKVVVRMLECFNLPRRNGKVLFGQLTREGSYAEAHRLEMSDCTPAPPLPQMNVKVHLNDAKQLLCSPRQVHGVCLGRGTVCWILRLPIMEVREPSVPAPVGARLEATPCRSATWSLPGP